MRIKFSPCKTDTKNTEITFVDENTLDIDSEIYEFDTDSVVWPDIFKQSGGVILEAHRDKHNELYVTVIRYYTQTTENWDTGDYHAVSWEE